MHHPRLTAFIASLAPLIRINRERPLQDRLILRANIPHAKFMISAVAWVSVSFVYIIHTRIVKSSEFNTALLSQSIA